MDGDELEPELASKAPQWAQKLFSFGLDTETKDK